MSSTSPDRAALGVVYFTVFLDLLGFGIILPWLPYYAAELGASGIGLGFLFTSYSLAQLVGATVLGRLSDRHGRRPILLMSLAGSMAGFVFSGLANSLIALCLARAVAGLFGGSISIAQAYVADVTEKDNRARYMGFVGASIGLGFVVGPALGAGFIALGLGFPAVAFTSAGLAAVNLVLAAWKVREPRERAASRSRSLASWREALGQPGLSRVLAATFCTTFAFVGMETTFAFLGRDRFGFDNLRFGLVLTYVGVIMIIVQGALIGRLTGRFEVRWIAVAGSLLMAVALAALPFAGALPTVLGALGLLAAGQGLVVPGLSTLTSQIAAAERQGSVLGFSQSIAASARVIGPLVAGGLYDLGAGLPYWTGGVLALTAGALVVSHRA